MPVYSTAMHNAGTRYIYSMRDGQADLTGWLVKYQDGADANQICKCHLPSDL